MTQEYLEEPKLSFATLEDDGFTIWLNGESKYSVRLPMDISRKKAPDRQKTIETTILNACNSFEIDYVSMNNIQGRAKEIVDLLYERERVRRVAVSALIEQEEEVGEEQETTTTPPPATPVEPKIELTEDLIKEITFDYVAEILDTSIKKDKAPKVITFCGMLLAQTNDDQLNIGFQAESSAGKSYIPLEVASYFPKDEIEIIASASPTAFYHDGTWDGERKVLVRDLRHKNLIFLDQPHFQLLEKLRPLLSHDSPELHYKITDKNQKHGLRTKNVIIKGPASFFFCTAKTDPDEQEKTRMFMLSPETEDSKFRETLKLIAFKKGDIDEYTSVVIRDEKRLWLQKRICSIRQWGIREANLPNCGEEVYNRFLKEHEHLKSRHQRDFQRVIALIKAHALLNCFKREKKEGKPDTIIATQKDIDEGFKLYKEVEESNELGLSPYLYKIYQDVFQPLLKQYSETGASREQILKRYYEVKHKNLSPQVLRSDIIPQLEAVGLIQEEPDPTDKRRMLLYPTVSNYISQSKIDGGDGQN